MITANFLKFTNHGIKFYDWQSNKQKHSICDVTSNIKPYLFYDCYIDNATLFDIFKFIEENKTIFSNIFNYDLSFIHVCKNIISSDYEYLTLSWDISNWDDIIEIMPNIYGNDKESLIYNDIEEILDLPIKINPEFVIREEHIKDISGKNVTYSHFGDMQFSLFDIIKLIIQEIKIDERN